jgi:2-succinyl-5-enolpyruvyl-6-hydroxy-3-cyclohexene-1-carboxylate synthase
LVSTSWGAAVCHGREKPTGRTIALLGDLAFLHDHNGLLAPKHEDRPNLTIVVADNNGGGIFSSLEQADPRFESDFERVFGTPPDVSLLAIAEAVGVPVIVVGSGVELAEALAARSQGVQVVVATCVDRNVEQEVWSRLLV